MYGLEKPAIKLLEVVANFDIANQAVHSAPAEVKNYLTGFKMIHQSLINVLKTMEIHEIMIEAGDEFDPIAMEVGEEEESKDIPSGKVIRVETKGYRLHDRVLIVAKVILSI
jgi:molecular chaperone GrpE